MIFNIMLISIYFWMVIALVSIQTPLWVDIGLWVIMGVGILAKLASLIYNKFKRKRSVIDEAIDDLRRGRLTFESYKEFRVKMDELGPGKHFVAVNVTKVDAQ